MITGRLSRLYSVVIRASRYAAPILRIYTRTFVGSRHRYTEGYIQVLKKNVERTKPIAFRYCKGSEFVQRLTAVAFDVMSDHMLVDEWYAYQWEQLYYTLLGILQFQYNQHVAAVARSSSPNAPIDSIHSYIIEERIGDISTCSTVYKALREDHHVALKAMFNFNCENEAEMLRFENFGAELITEELNLPPHPNIIRINSYFVSDNEPQTTQAAEEYGAVFLYGMEKTLYIEMPLYSDSLSQYLASRRLAESEIIWVLFQIISSVHHISRHNIVHRDIKLDNILVLEEAQASSLTAVLTDFGMAHNSLQTQGHPHGRKWGNPQIMPPEIANSHNAQETLDYSKADIWCVGSLVYELCGQANPFSAASSQNYHVNNLAQLDSPNQILELLAHKMLSYDISGRLNAHQCFLICGAMIWLPDVVNASKRTTVEVVARQLTVLSFEVLKCANRTHEQIMLMYFLQHADSKSICETLNKL